MANICFNDNHVDTLDTFWPPAVGYIPNTGAEIKKDNIYNAEFTDYDADGYLSADNFLCMYEGHFRAEQRSDVDYAAVRQADDRSVIVV